ncbi:hypothetical protein UPYG_G00173220 [Umbra pygmaea]|uniref:PRA1 family protein n=1 Tax=Umbra pygmaea TaxID=75934 RepID=A0ABD0WU13_UMBPY
MARVELTPLRPWDDFFPGFDRYAKPDVRDLPKWNNRVVNNLLYYQTNYLLLACVVFFTVGILNPVGMFMGIVVVSLVFLGSVWAGENRSMIKDFKQQNPTLFVIAVLVASYFLMSLFNGVMVFLFGITFPLLLVFAHSSLRLRNIKNKLENKIEEAGLKKSPMGILLEVLGQQEVRLQKIQELLERKVKEGL